MERKLRRLRKEQRSMLYTQKSRVENTSNTALSQTGYEREWQKITEMYVQISRHFTVCWQWYVMELLSTLAGGWGWWPAWRG